MTIKLRKGVLRVSLTDRNGRWSLTKLNDRDVRIVGKCCGTRVCHEFMNLGAELTDILSRLSTPHRREKGDWMILTENETPVRFVCNYCQKQRHVNVKVELSKASFNAAKRSRYRDSYSGTQGGLIRIEGEFRGGKFEDWRPIRLICGECGDSFTDGDVQDFFDRFKREVEAYLKGEQDEVQPASKSFRLQCLCNAKQDISLKLSPVNLPQSRSEWYNRLLEYIPYSTDVFKGRLVHVQHRVSPLRAAEGEVGETPPSLFNITKVKGRVPNA